MTTQNQATVFQELWKLLDDFRGTVDPQGALELFSMLLLHKRSKEIGRCWRLDLPTGERRGSAAGDVPWGWLEMAGDAIEALASGKNVGLIQGIISQLFRVRDLEAVRQLVARIDRFSLPGDLTGDLFEGILDQLSTVGFQGQFYTPRPLVRLMVDLVDPRPGEVVGDPACGTAGFLVAVREHLTRLNLPPGQTRLVGFDLVPSMLRLAAVNLLLHGTHAPELYQQNSLSVSLGEQHPDLARDAFDVILTDPPVGSRVDESVLEPSLTHLVKTRDAEELFLALVYRLLKPGGRAAILVPAKTLFASSKAHVFLRQRLLAENQLDGIIGLPAWAFHPALNVPMAVLVARKGGRTKQVWMYDADRPAPGRRHPGNLTPLAAEVREAWSRRHETPQGDRAGRAFYVDSAELLDNNLDLTVSRYRTAAAMPADADPLDWPPPAEILDRLLALEQEINQDLNRLRGLMG